MAADARPRRNVPANPRHAIVLVGDELLSGRRADGNGLWLARELHARGVEVVGITIVGDDEEAIHAAVRSAAGRADVVVVGGGLGPTPDDRTREGLARAAGRPLVHDADAWRSVVEALATRGRVSTPAAERQGLLPAGARWHPNPEGTAPGIELALRGVRVFAFPGVPREWRALCRAQVLARLADGEVAAETEVWVAGMPEAEVMDSIGAVPELRGVDLASYPHDGEIELRFRATGDDRRARAEAARDAVRTRLGAAAFDPPPGGRIQHVVVEALRSRGLRVATAESITGGLVARKLTAVPGASAVFPVGWITYATSEKTAQLGVPADLIEEHGVVSAEVARAMAEHARGAAGTDAALATTGTAGPEPLEQPGHEPVPPGRVHVALAMAGRATEDLELTLPFGRTLVQHHAAVRALDLLRRALMESPG